MVIYDYEIHTAKFEDQGSINTWKTPHPEDTTRNLIQVIHKNTYHDVIIHLRLGAREVEESGFSEMNRVHA
jgi:hypothetical protein